MLCGGEYILQEQRRFQWMLGGRKMLHCGLHMVKYLVLLALESGSLSSNPVSTTY